MPTDPNDSRNPTLVERPAAPRSSLATEDSTLNENESGRRRNQAQSAVAPDTLGRSGHAPPVEGYKPIEFLGAGTFGEVWSFQEDGGPIKVAIKFFVRASAQRREGLLAEATQLARLRNHDGIVRIEHVNAFGNPPFYIMSYAEGGSLQHRLQREKQLTPEEALIIFGEITDSLAYVHAKGIRHCDLKPSNILFDGARRPIIADFGQARSSDDPVPVLGTYFYMSPEQADPDKQDKVPDTRWDVYSLGALFYRMLTGHAPHETDDVQTEIKSATELVHRLRRYRDHLMTAPKPSEHRHLKGVDRALADIIDRCLETDPRKRFHDAAAVVSALEQRVRRIRQRPLLYFGLITPLLLLIIIGTATTIHTRRAAAQFSENWDAQLKQLLAGDRTAGNLIAHRVDSELLKRRRLVEMHANGPALRQAVKAGDVKQLKRLLTKIHTQEKDDVPDAFKWIAFDETGVTLKDSDNDVNEGTNFAWRDYFSGMGDQLSRAENGQIEQSAARFKPIDKPHVSQPFVSRPSKKKLVSISAPIRDPDNHHVTVGVLMVSIRLEDEQGLHRWFADHVKFADGFAVLVDRQGHCIHHNEGDRILPIGNEPWPSWPDEFRALQQAQSNDHESNRQPIDYTDPINGQTYSASYHPTSADLGWGVIVQRNRKMARDPVDNLRARLIWTNRIALVVLVVLTCAIQGVLYFFIRRQERLAHA